MSNPKPRVSIGLPVYNGENFLEAALASLLAQTFSDFEIVLSDNASTDGTEEICRRFAAADPRIRYLRQEKNRGMAWNYNHCFQQSQGEYFRWHAHDDLVHPEYTQACMDVLDAEQDVALCHSCTAIVTGDAHFPVESRSLEEGSPEMENVNDCRHSPLSDQPHARYGDVLLHTVWGYEIYGLARADAMRKTGLHRNYTCAEKVYLAELALLGKYREIPVPSSFHGNIANKRAGQPRNKKCLEMLDAKPRSRFVTPRQIKSVASHLGALCRLPLTPSQRLRSLAMLGRYVFRPEFGRRLPAGQFATRAPLGSFPQPLNQNQPPRKVYEGSS